MLTGSVLVQVYIRSQLVTHLCILLAELLMEVGPCPMYCSLNLTVLSTNVCVFHPKSYNKNSPTLVIVLNSFPPSKTQTF